MKWRLHDSKHHSEEECSRPSDRLTLGSPRAGRTIPDKCRLGDQPPDFAKQAHRSSVHGALEAEAPIFRLPTEVILEIASNTTPCSRACLALSSKRIFCVISDGFNDVFDGLQLPAEIPRDNPPFSVANDWPLMYQPKRWNFLCLLQKDLLQKDLLQKDFRQWLACSDCLVLHPAQWFGQTEVAVWPLKRSCPQCRPPKLEHLSRNKVPRGIVDLCPCIKLTQGKKSTLVDYLERHEEHREQEHPCLRGIGTCLPPASGPWSHECRAVYSTGMVYTKIHPYLLEAGGLVVIIEYTCNRNLQTWRPGLRLTCPHCYLDNWDGNFFFHQSFHSFNLPC